MALRKINFALELCFSGVLPAAYQNKLVNSFTNKPYESKITSAPLEYPPFFEIQDVPDYLIIEHKTKEPIKLQRINRYKGYLVDLTKFEGVEDLLQKKLSRNPRKNLRAKLRKLEKDHDIQYQFYWGHIDKQHYDDLFDSCYELMKARFQQKRIHNRFLLHWKFFYELFYPRILNKEASINVIYDGSKPITITLNFHRGDIVFSFIQIYDIAYHQYSMGDIAMLKNLDWSYENGFSVWDVSKGETDNKLRWCNHHYTYESHIFYDPNTVVSKLKLKVKSAIIQLKDRLRKRGIIGGLIQFDVLFYYLYRSKVKNQIWQKDSSDLFAS